VYVQRPYSARQADDTHDAAGKHPKPQVNYMNNFLYAHVAKTKIKGDGILRYFLRPVAFQVMKEIT
jgi:hypothetical protein